MQLPKNGDLQFTNRTLSRLTVVLTNKKRSMQLLSPVICQIKCSSTQLTASLLHFNKSEYWMTSQRLLRLNSIRCTCQPGIVLLAEEWAAMWPTKLSVISLRIGARWEYYFGEQKTSPQTLTCAHRNDAFKLFLLS